MYNKIAFLFFKLRISLYMVWENIDECSIEYFDQKSAYILPHVPVPLNKYRSRVLYHTRQKWQANDCTRAGPNMSNQK